MILSHFHTKTKQHGFHYVLIKGYFPLPPFIPVTPCVDCCIVYDNSAKGVKRIFNMLLVCFCTSHRCFPPSPTWGGAWFTVTFLIQRWAVTTLICYCPLIIYKRGCQHQYKTVFIFIVDWTFHYLVRKFKIRSLKSLASSYAACPRPL